MTPAPALLRPPLRPGGFWPEWEECWRDALQGTESHAAFAFELTSRLVRGPANLHPQDRPAVTIQEWRDRYHAATEPAVLNARQWARENAYVSREERRVEAILSLHLLADANPVTAETARHTIYQWIAEVIRHSEDRWDAYFPTYRCRDVRTYGSSNAKAEDPYTLEVILLLTELRDGVVRLRKPFREHWDEFLYKVIEWLFHRYEFDWATFLLGEIRAPADYAVTGRVRRRIFDCDVRRRGLMVRAWVPRLLFATLIGHFAAGTQTDVWKFLAWLGARPVLCAGYVMVDLALFGALIAWEVTQRAPLRGHWQRSAARIALVGLAATLVCGVFSTAAALIANSPAAGCKNVAWFATAVASPYLAFSTTALLMGYVLQLLWEDRPVSDRI